MQQRHTLDARGLLCPQPLIKTRRLLKTLQAGEQFQVQVDNDIARLNLVTFLEDQGMKPEYTAENGVWTITATCQLSGRQPEKVQPVVVSDATLKAQPAVMPIEKASGYIVVLNSDCMGQGDDDLGRILIKGYLNTLREIDNKPSSIILYNGGALLAADGSGAETALQALAQFSVDVIVCGACVDFFDLQETMVAGRISNMYEIAEKIAAADHVVYP